MQHNSNIEHYLQLFINRFIVFFRYSKLKEKYSQIAKQNPNLSSEANVKMIIRVCTVFTNNVHIVIYTRQSCSNEREREIVSDNNQNNI